MERFAGAYPAQLQDFAAAVLAGRPPSITIDDGMAVMRIAIAATRACHSGQPVEVARVDWLNAGLVAEVDPALAGAVGRIRLETPVRVRHDVLLHDEPAGVAVAAQRLDHS